eukprot:CAMPEP_0194764866 /NCGR_PEP_ID=MMETSP0323_2-20130528/23900_1 /TAXON_ID=2866 ORGANISM="Crypthecodinium cohnii, Strain Seligo" /NCGR_SAMPLE_ID=MMETSP0323_2 /ASSEMBLY_ACC=CAM_ASM_000346 /LENGTH=107 /DNA_ID=CAMNT_0039692987 /DNA_START=246 /DNA_END=566 /DNA_ORIENTATION=-
MSEHVGEDEVSDLRSSKVHLLQVCHLSVTASNSDTFQHCIHVVLAVHKVTSIHFSRLQLASDSVSDAFMQELHRDTDRIRHRTSCSSWRIENKRKGSNTQTWQQGTS